MQIALIVRRRSHSSGIVSLSGVDSLEVLVKDPGHGACLVIQIRYSGETEVLLERRAPVGSGWVRARDLAAQLLAQRALDSLRPNTGETCRALLV